MLLVIVFALFKKKKGIQNSSYLQNGKKRSSWLRNKKNS